MEVQTCNQVTFSWELIIYQFYQSMNKMSSNILYLERSLKIGQSIYHDHFPLLSDLQFFVIYMKHDSAMRKTQATLCQTYTERLKSFWG